MINQGDIKEWLPHITPDFDWFSIQIFNMTPFDTGICNVLGVALYKDTPRLFMDYAIHNFHPDSWSNGHAPQTQDEVIRKSIGFEHPLEALAHIKIQKYPKPVTDSAASALIILEDVRNGKSV